MRKILTMLLCSVCLLTAKAQTIPNMYRNVDQAKMNHWVDSVFDKMSYDERIGQLFMVISNRNRITAPCNGLCDTSMK